MFTQLTTMTTAIIAVGLISGLTVSASADPTTEACNRSHSGILDVSASLTSGPSMQLDSGSLASDTRLIIDVRLIGEYARLSLLSAAVQAPVIAEDTPNGIGEHSRVRFSKPVSTSTSGPYQTSVYLIDICRPNLEAAGGSGTNKGPEEAGFAKMVNHIPEPSTHAKTFSVKSKKDRQSPRFSFQGDGDLRPSIDGSNSPVHHAEEFSQRDIDVWALLKMARADDPPMRQDGESF